MNWVEVLLLAAGLATGGSKLARWAYHRHLRKNAEERANRLICNCGCAREVDERTGCYAQGRWWRPECWQKFNQ